MYICVTSYRWSHSRSPSLISKQVKSKTSAPAFFSTCELRGNSTTGADDWEIYRNVGGFQFPATNMGWSNGKFMCKFPVNVHLHQFGEWLSDILGCGWFLSGSTKDVVSMFEDLDYNHLYAWIFHHVSIDPWRHHWKYKYTSWQLLHVIATQVCIHMHNANLRHTYPIISYILDHLRA